MVPLGASFFRGDTEFVLFLLVTGGPLNPPKKGLKKETSPCSSPETWLWLKNMYNNRTWHN